MAVKTGAATPRERADRTKQPESRAQERSIRDAVERERREQGTIATTNVPTDPEDAITTARFIGGLRQRREEAGLSLTDVAERSGIDKASLSRLENGWYPNPTLNT
jgi:predicted transcriptional regulator